jgi:hypothetical protein
VTLHAGIRKDFERVPELVTDGGHKVDIGPADVHEYEEQAVRSRQCDPPRQTRGSGTRTFAFFNQHDSVG